MQQEESHAPGTVISEKQSTAVKGTKFAFLQDHPLSRFGAIAQYWIVGDERRDLMPYIHTPPLSAA